MEHKLVFETKTPKNFHRLSPYGHDPLALCFTILFTSITTLFLFSFLKLELVFGIALFYSKEEGEIGFDDRDLREKGNDVSLRMTSIQKQKRSWL